MRNKLILRISIPTPCFPHFYYILVANLGSLLHGDVSVIYLQNPLHYTDDFMLTFNFKFCSDVVLLLPPPMKNIHSLVANLRSLLHEDVSVHYTDDFMLTLISSFVSDVILLLPLPMKNIHVMSMIHLSKIYMLSTIQYKLLLSAGDNNFSLLYCTHPISDTMCTGNLNMYRLSHSR